MDLYDILGVERDASVKEIRKAGRKLSQKYHPDRNPGDETCKAKFEEVQVAVEVLCDEERRRLFDSTGQFSNGNFQAQALLDGLLSEAIDKACQKGISFTTNDFLQTFLQFVEAKQKEAEKGRKTLIDYCEKTKEIQGRTKSGGDIMEKSLIAIYARWKQEIANFDRLLMHFADVVKVIKSAEYQWTKQLPGAYSYTMNSPEAMYEFFRMQRRY